MLLCPKCKSPNKHFQVTRHLSEVVTINCDDDGDYTEKAAYSNYCEWDHVYCLDCERVIDEQEARACFEDQPDHWSAPNGCEDDCPACSEEVDAELRRREP